MSTPSLPDHPDLDQLRRRARELQRRVRTGAADALALVRRHLSDPPTNAFPLHLAQLALARRHGFSGWPALVRHARELRRYGRDPQALEPQHPDPLDDFLLHAVLRYTADDGPDRWAHARDVLDAHPELPGASLHAAAALGDVDAVRDHLASDPSGATTEGGPLRWPPILYLTYARTTGSAAADPVTALGLLLTSGADPNAGYLWRGDPPPFTALTGVFGDGEQGSTRQPPHPRAAELAHLLLAAGADPNDGQTLYNRMFSAADDHLEVLFAHGLGTGDGGPWRRRLPELIEEPAALVRGQLDWAVTHGLTGRIRLLARQGVDLVQPLDQGPGPLRTGLTPLQLARRSGNAAVARLLLELGVPDEVDDPDGRLLAALLAGDRVGVASIVEADAEVITRVRASHPALVLRAAVLDQLDAVRLAVDLGFSVDAYGRQDLPLQQEWETALHHAAGEGKTELVRLLLELGADPELRDHRFSATPLQWAEHLGQPHTAAQLEPLTGAG